MNSCILMAEITDEPQLRYTPDGLELTDMMVQFAGARPEDPPSMLRVVAWKNLATEIKQNYHKGDRVILEGRLGMNKIARREGFKETQAELTVQRIHSLGAGFDMGSPPSMESSPGSYTPQNYGEAPNNNTAPPRETIPTYEPSRPAPTHFEPIPQNDFSDRYVPQNAPQSPPQKAPQSNSYDRKPYVPPTQNDEPDVDDIPF
jgi:single-strand DNA-binding protein